MLSYQFLLYGGSEVIAIVMQQIGAVLGRPRTTEQLSTGSNGVRPTEQLSTERVVITKLDNRSVDEALAKTADLINDQFKSWYAMKARELGYWRYIGLSHDARRGRQPKKLFSYLLRKAA